MDITNNSQLAGAPFDDKNYADLILRSVDNVDFHVHKQVLYLASHFFRDMLSLPQPEGSGNRDRQAPLLEMSEDSATLDALLRFCYPVRDPIVEELSIAANILEAANKYQMDEAIEIVKELVKKFAPSQPLTVYGIACRPSISDEPLARFAAQKWMQNKRWVASNKIITNEVVRKGRGGCITSERLITMKWEETTIAKSYDNKYMESTTAGQLYRLVHCIRLQTLPPALIRHLDSGIVEDASTASTPYRLDDNLSTTTECISNFTDGNIIIQSSDGITFCVHRIILQLASRKLLSYIVARGRIQDQDSPSEIPVFPLSEHSSIISKILEICDPSVSVVGNGEADLMHNILRMAMEYDIPKAVSFVKLWWADLVKANPVRTYFAAVRYGWEEQAGLSARATVYSSIESAYTPEMEHVPARSYYYLMKYHHGCREKLRDAFQRHSILSCDRISLNFYQIMTSTWVHEDKLEDPSKKTQWNDEMIAGLMSVLQVCDLLSPGLSGFSESWMSDRDLDSFMRKLKANLSEIKLDWDS